MRLLALETATADCSVALLVDGRVQSVASVGGERPSEQVPDLIRQLLAEAGLGVTQLDAVAFDAGPGAFTGIRIGCGLAQGLALGADLPLIGLSSLMVLAMQAPAGRVVSMLDARMGEVYWAPVLRRGEAGVDGDAREAAWLDDPHVVAPGDWVCPSEADCAIGDGLNVAVLTDEGSARVADRLLPSVRVLSMHARPQASDMLPLAAQRLLAGEAFAPELASPLYVRDKVALTAAEQLARRAAR